MGALTEVKVILLTVLYMVVCVFLVVLVILQKGEGGLGSIAGNSSSVLGTSSGSVFTKITYIFAVLFFLGALSLSIMSSDTKSLVDQANLGDKKSGVKAGVEDNRNAEASSNSDTKQ